MAYVGNNLTVQQYAPTNAYFNGTGSQTVFTLPISVVSAAQIIVSIENVIQNPSTAYSVSGTTLTFTSAPPSGSSNIWVTYISLQSQQTGPWYFNNGQVTYTGNIRVNGGSDFVNNGAGDSRALYVANGNAAGLPNGLIYGYNANDANDSSYNFLQFAAGSTIRFIVYGDGTINSTGGLTTKSRGITKSSLPPGSVIQVVTGTNSTAASSSTSAWADTGLTATITPTSATSKIMVFINHTMCFKDSPSGSTGLAVQALRNSTGLISVPYMGYNGQAAQSYFPLAFSFIDSPASTSALVYKTQFNSWQNTASVAVQAGNTTSTITLMEIAV